MARPAGAPLLAGSMKERSKCSWEEFLQNQHAIVQRGSAAPGLHGEPRSLRYDNRRTGQDGKRRESCMKNWTQHGDARFELRR